MGNRERRITVRLDTLDEAEKALLDAYDEVAGSRRQEWLRRLLLLGYGIEARVIRSTERKRGGKKSTSTSRNKKRLPPSIREIEREVDDYVDNRTEDVIVDTRSEEEESTIPIKNDVSLTNTSNDIENVENEVDSVFDVDELTGGFSSDPLTDNDSVEDKEEKSPFAALKGGNLFHSRD